MDDIGRTLRKECNLCDACIRLYIDGSEATSATNVCGTSTSTHDNTSCTLCLGLLSKHDDFLSEQIVTKLKRKMSPYVGAAASAASTASKSSSIPSSEKNHCDSSNSTAWTNFISKDSPTIVLPNIIIVIAHCVNCAIDELICREEEHIREEMNKLSSESKIETEINSNDHNQQRRQHLQKKQEQLLRYRIKHNSKNNPIDIYNQIKELVRCKVRKIIREINSEYNKKLSALHEQNGSTQGSVNLNIPRDKEEAGYLKFHLVFTQPLLFPYLPFASTNSKNGGRTGGTCSSTGQAQVLHLPKLSTKRQRKRFRGNDPMAKQGGDPRMNLNSFVKAKLLSVQKKMQRDSTYGQSDKVNLSKNGVRGDVIEMNAGTETEKNVGNVDETYQVMERNSIVEDNLHCCLLEKNLLAKHLETLGSRDGIKKELSQWMLGINNKVTACQQQHKGKNDSNIKCGGDIDDDIKNNIGIFVSCWRNHFYLKGKYTKSRRDVSQTPFFVNDDQNDSPKETCGDKTQEVCTAEKEQQQQQHKRMKRLGISSVEEEICPIICDLGCNGISDANNEIQVSDSNEGKKNCSTLVYGMCKFHASGREDMDVRMILPLEADKEPKGDERKLIGSGRPFVCEVIDAYKMPTIEDLNHVVQKINKIDSGNNGDNNESSVLKEITLSGEGEWVNEGTRKHVQYGCNPNGVGISGLSYCQSSSFSNLQSETEDKVKFYGCLCWSRAQIPSQAYIEEKLIIGEAEKSIYPLQIEQSTPLRVLHRRSASSRTRHVLSMKVIRIDDHWFRLHLSTSAGTYVKEFCHGDCGRTKPSISSLLGCRVDIVELDCEGIAV
mmetsp:Transcript_7756/g.11775  ORF Transcript_7756/g.11775 Transcript_7756/m.11775 type:complete len:832 (-) Transcript_7756:142-2637(-)